MKVFVQIGIFATLIAIAASLFWGNTAPRVCVIDYRTCNTNTNVCGRFGQSNLCARFTNLCALQLANCQQATSYTRIALARCQNIAVNNRGTCNGLTSTTGVVING